MGSAEPPVQPPVQQPVESEPEWVRRKRLAEVFGDVLPDTTSDERGTRAGKGDQWYRDQIPPHHGS